MAVPTILMAATVEGAGIGGRLAVEVSLPVVVVPRVAAVRTALVGLEADVKTTTKDVALAALAGGDQETLEVAPTARTEEETPLMKVTTTDEGSVVVAAPN